MATFVFGFMVLFMGAIRFLLNSAQLAWTDIMFVLLFAVVMALLTCFRPRLFQ